MNTSKGFAVIVLRYNEVMNRRIFLWVVLGLVLLWVGVMVFQTNKPLPDGVSVMGGEYAVPVDSVKFLADRTYVDGGGVRHSDQEIFDEVFQMIRGAREYILVDMFLYNSFQGSAPETTRALSSELTDALIVQKQAYPNMSVTVISDPLNTVYGGDESPDFERLRQARVNVVLTDLGKLRDSNPLYSSGWRTLLQWFGNSPGGFLPHPFAAGGDGVSVRSWLSLLNFKANHRKLIVADVPQSDGSVKLATLVTSANPHDGSSAHSNVAVRVDDKIWQDAIVSEQAVGIFSDRDVPGFVESVADSDGAATVQLLTEGAIDEKLVSLLDSAQRGDSVDMAMFYLSKRSVVRALERAAVRGAIVRLILDPNRDAFGHTKNGVPNRPVAHELVSKSDGHIQVRWCDTHGEQCHSKFTIFVIDGRRTVVVGSANLTRRNIGDYNLETDILYASDDEIPAVVDARRHFEEIWYNADGQIHTTDYETYANSSFLLRLLYRFQEATGLSSF